MPNKTLQNKIESIMTGPGKAPAISLATFLFWLSRVYAGFQKLRSACYRRHLIASQKLPCRVISIGNITVGGTGKTPMTIFIAERLRQFGYRIVVISRGYKGRARKTGTIVSDGQSVRADPDSTPMAIETHPARFIKSIRSKGIFARLSHHHLRPTFLSMISLQTVWT